MALFIVTLNIPVNGPDGRQIGNVWFPFEPDDERLDSIAALDHHLKEWGTVTGTQYDRTRREDERAYGRGYVKEPVLLGLDGVATIKMASPRRQREFEAQVIGDLTKTPFHERVD